jgi:hypothetical protein
MSECGRYVKKSSENNYSCMKKGIDVGSRVKLPPGYRPQDKNEIYCNSSTSALSSPYLCFKKGLAIGKKNQYETKKYKIKEDFIEFSKKTPLRSRWSDDDASSIDQKWYFLKDENDISGLTLFIAILIGFITFGFFLAFKIYWLWAIIIGIVSSSLFLYFCNCQP